MSAFTVEEKKTKLQCIGWESARARLHKSIIHPVAKVWSCVHAEWDRRTAEAWSIQPCWEFQPAPDSRAVAAKVDLTALFVAGLAAQINLEYKLCWISNDKGDKNRSSRRLFMMWNRAEHRKMQNLSQQLISVKEKPNFYAWFTDN